VRLEVIVCNRTSKTVETGVATVNIDRFSDIEGVLAEDVERPRGATPFQNLPAAKMCVRNGDPFCFDYIVAEKNKSRRESPEPIAPMNVLTGS
jgi:hypothetical protein